jgi:hypothetical protein
MRWRVGGPMTLELTDEAACGRAALAAACRAFDQGAYQGVIKATDRHLDTPRRPVYASGEA